MNAQNLSSIRIVEPDSAARYCWRGPDMKWLVWAALAGAGLFLVVTEIYPAIHAWRVKMEYDAAAAAAQRDQAQAQAGALTDVTPPMACLKERPPEWCAGITGPQNYHAPLNADVDAGLRAKGIAPSTP